MPTEKDGVIIQNINIFEGNRVIEVRVTPFEIASVEGLEISYNIYNGNTLNIYAK